MSAFGVTAGPVYPNIRAGLKWLAHRHPLLLTTARIARDRLFSSRPKTRKILAGFDPLCLDEDLIAELTKISPTLRDEILAEFAEVSRVLGGAATGLGESARWLAQHPLDHLPSSATNLNLVYTPGKVGTTTTLAALERHPAIQGAVSSVHFLSSKGHAFVEQMLERHNPWPQFAHNWRDDVLRTRMLRVMVAINRAMRANPRPSATALRKPFVVAGVREPMALHVSFCFEGWWFYADTPEGVTTDIVHQQLTRDAWHRHCNNWFTDELYETFGVNVYAQPFQTERGWAIYENDQARVMLIRQENLAVLADALGALYGLDPNSFQVIPANVAEDKVYVRPYDNAKKTLRLSEPELESIYSLPYVRHFYTPKEIAAFKNRWRATDATRKAA